MHDMKKRQLHSIASPTGGLTLQSRRRRRADIASSLAGLTTITLFRLFQKCPKRLPRAAERHFPARAAAEKKLHLSVLLRHSLTYCASMTTAGRERADYFSRA